MQGSRTYIYNLATHLLEKESRHEFVLYFKEFPADLPPAWHRPYVRLARLQPAGRWARLTYGLPRQLARDGVDLWHCQYVAPPMLPCPYVVSLHDIIHSVHPEWYPPRLRWFMRLTYPPSARRAARVLTLSEYSRDAIVRLYRVPPARVVVTGAAAGQEFRPVTDRAAIRAAQARYGVPDNYLLYVGRLEPRKNLPTLIHAYDDLRRRDPVVPPLVIAGAGDFGFAGLYQLVRRLDLAGRVLFSGTIAPADLPLLFNGAALFVYPSFAEGFGLPPLEAMACGVPAVVSTAAAVKEVVGDAAVTVDPSDIRGLADALQRVLGDAVLRADLASRGLARARLFTWRQVARQILACYDELDSARRS